VVHETFDVAIPDDIPAGTYAWHVGWYNASHPEAYLTDQHSRLGAEVVIHTVSIE
jgi:hypothetical protein